MDELMQEEPHQTRARRGHAAIAAIISDMENYLPPPNTSRPGYAGCRTTYGLLTRFHQQAESSSSPAKEYKELQQIETDLRRRITSLDAKKGVPEKMTLLMNELRDALAAALAQGLTTDYFLESAQALVDGEPETIAEAKIDREMVPRRRLVKVWDELKAAQERIRRLNEENNRLALRVMQLEGRRGPVPYANDELDESGEPPCKRMRRSGSY
ncbi:hypothetical protein NX059_007224 [Plenodomus lindquistii]|nr:hypothetical protein NX059_007224 [Plenodomus lindquistii]